MNYQVKNLTIAFILLALTSLVSASKSNQALKFPEEKIGNTDEAVERFNVDS